MTHTYEQFAEGFVPTAVLYDEPSDSQGYVGYMPSNNSIYVVFRGSESVANWLTDFDATQTYYETWPECNCKVHNGFYRAVQAMQPDALAEVKRLRQQFPWAEIKTAGHSLGGA